MNKLRSLYTAIGLTLFFKTAPAFATTTNFPWDDRLIQFGDSITGPVAFVGALTGLVYLAWGLLKGQGMNSTAVGLFFAFSLLGGGRALASAFGIQQGVIF